MTHVLICRHSKAQSSHSSGTDWDRELAPEGERDARAVGAEIVRRGLVPDLVLASDSRRTRQTTSLIVAELPSEPETVYLPQLYSAPAGGVLDTVASYADGRRSILVVGHNPGVEDLVSLIARKEVRLRTSTVAVLEMDGARAPGDDPLAGLHLAELFGPRVQ